MSLIYETDPAGIQKRRTRLYLGGKSDAKNREWLEKKGISHILNVTPTKEVCVQAGVPNYFESSKNFKYKRVPVYDAPTSDLLSHADQIVNFIASGLIHGSVLVHCQRGVSRSSVCVAFYLLRKTEMCLEEIMILMATKRPQVRPLAAFLEQLKKYEERYASSLDEKDKSREKKRRHELGEDGQKKTKIIGPSMPQTVNRTIPPQSINKSNQSSVIGPLMPQQVNATATTLSIEDSNEASVIDPAVSPS